MSESARRASRPRARRARTEGDRPHGPAEARGLAAAAPDLVARPLAGSEIAFGSFRFLPQTRQLLLNASPVRLGSRARDVLALLAGRLGDPVPNDELIAAVWPGIHVESNTLRVHIAALRRVLGAEEGGHDYIVNFSGRGYALIPPPAASPRPDPAIPATHLIGRDALVAEVTRQLATQRLVTLVGPGGVGKTALALRVAATAAGKGRDVAVVDFSPLLGGELFTAHIATRLGLPSSSPDATATILQYLSGRAMLLVLDTCEHVIADAARFAATVLARAPEVRMLATSREGMRIAGEHIRFVRGLEVPEARDATPDAALAFPAVRLFIERAMAASADMRFGTEHALAVADICRRLDGLPLAIELAAALAPHFGVDGLARALSDRFAVLTSGYRTALPRHQTLRATVEWSYRLLTEAERAVFRRFGIFRDTVSREDAVAVLVCEGLDAAGVAQALHRLTAKSLIDMWPDGEGVRCRMLDTNRDFAQAELATRCEFDSMAMRHAGHWAARLERWSPDSMSDAGRRGECEAMLANIRAALRWCWSCPERHPLAVRLTLAVVPLWINLSLIAETIENVGRAIAALDAADPAQRSALMRLHAALGGALMNIDGGGERVRAAWSKVRELAVELDDTRAHLQALWGLWVDRRNRGGAREAFAIAETYARLADGMDDPLFARLADRMRGVSCFFVGRLGEARRYLERMLAHSDRTTRRAQIAAFQFDQTIAARCFLAQTLWLQGVPDQARTLAESNVQDALACDHAGSLSYSLSEAACPIALRSGDLDGLERNVALLLARTKGPGLEIWHTLGRGFESFLLIGRGRHDDGLGQLGAVLGELRDIRHGPLFIVLLTEYALLLSEAGDLDGAERALGEAAARLERNEELWYRAEILRARAELAVRRGAVDEARRGFDGALAESRRQGALAWELRAATGLARFCRDHGEDGGAPGAAAGTLTGVLARYGEGWETVDLRSARALLGTL